MSVKIGKVTVNVDKIAEGILDMMQDMDPCYHTAIKFGMLPAPMMAALDKSLKARAAEIGEDSKWVNDMERAIGLKMLDKSDIVV